MFYLHQVMIGTFFFLFAYESYRQWKDLNRLTEKDQDQELNNRFQTAESYYQRGKIEEAKSLFFSICKESKRGHLFNKGAFRLAQIEMKNGALSQAQKWLFAIDLKNDESVETCKQEVLFSLKRYKEALKIGETLFHLRHRYDVCVRNALCCAHINDTKACQGWLRMARMMHPEKMDSLLARPEFLHIGLK
ncbi:hypothetical protein N9Y92_03255 [Chlamydiales bacterium]|nr:hypothetical protein [Chlamydiales bacterium]